MSTTVATCITTLRERLDEPTPAQWTDVQLRRWLNEGIRDIARRTMHLTDVKTIAVSAGTGTYTSSADVLRINHVYFSPTADTTRKIPLEARAWDSLDNIWWDQQDRATGDPILFGVYGYSPSVTLKLFPTPTRAGTLYLHVARTPAVLDVTGGSGNIDCPEGWLELALDYAEYMALRKDRDERWKDAYALFNEKLTSMIQQGDYLNVAGEFSWDGPTPVPRWLTDPNW